MQHIAASRILFALLLGVIAAAANVIGGLAIVRRQWSHSFLKYFIALGAGFMLATAFLEMIPESLKLATRTDEVFFLVLGGYLLIHFFEHTVAPHFHFGEETHSEQLAPAHAGITAVLGLVIHTFFDGVAIASGVLVSTWLGGIIFLAVFLHKLPEGSTVASLTLASGQSRRVALLSSVVLGGATIAGVGLMYVLRGAVGIALPFSAGVTIYVAASDLMPEVNREPAVGLPVLVFLGVLAMLVLKLAFHL